MQRRVCRPFHGAAGQYLGSWGFLALGPPALGPWSFFEIWRGWLVAGWAAHQPLFPCRLVPGGGALALGPCYSPHMLSALLCWGRVAVMPPGQLFGGGSQVLLSLGLRPLSGWGICWPPVPLCVCLLLGCCSWLASWLPLGEVHLALGSPSWWVRWAMWWTGFPTLLLAGR